MLDLVSAACVSLCNKHICTPSQDQVVLTAAIRSRILCQNLLPITGTQKVLKGNAGLSVAVLKLKAQCDDIADHACSLGMQTEYVVSAMTSGFPKNASVSLKAWGRTLVKWLNE